MTIKIKIVMDSKNYHKYEVGEDGIIGTLYLPKDQPIPKEIKLEVTK